MLHITLVTCYQRKKGKIKNWEKILRFERQRDKKVDSHIRVALIE